MPISRVYQTGNELNSFYTEYTDILGVPGWVTLSSAQKKTGSYSLAVYGNGNSNNHACARVTLSSELIQLRTGFHLYPNLTFPTSDASPIFSLIDSAGNKIVWLQVSTLGQYQFIREGGTQVGSNYPVVINSWIHVGMDVKKNASSGWVYLFLDGSLIASFDGNTATTGVKYLYYGSYPAITANTPYNGNCYFDDQFLDNSSGETSPTEIEDIRFDYVTVNSSGTYSEWTCSSGSNHWPLVDEVPPSSTDYVYATSAGLRDSYKLSTYTLSSNSTIEAVIPTVYAKKESAVDNSVGIGIGLSGTFLINSYQSLSTGYGLVKSERYTGTPLGAVWSSNDLTNLELYIMSSGTYA